MMMYALAPIPIPPHPIFAFDAVTFWVMIAFEVMLVVLATSLWIIGSRRVQRQQAAKVVPQQPVISKPEKVLQPLRSPSLP